MTEARNRHVPDARKRPLAKTTNKERSPAEVEALAEDLRNVVGKFVRSVRSRTNTPTDAQGETLAFLERIGPASIAALAESRGVKHQSMRLVTAKLKEAGLIDLLPDPDDKRGYLVNVTKAGLAVTSTARKARTLWIAEALATTLSLREMQTLEDAIPLLKRIADLG